MERCMEQRYADKKFCNCKIVGFIVISVEKSPETSLFPDFFLLHLSVSLISRVLFRFAVVGEAPLELIRNLELDSNLMRAVRVMVQVACVELVRVKDVEPRRRIHA